MVTEMACSMRWNIVVIADGGGAPFDFEEVVMPLSWVMYASQQHRDFPTKTAL